MSETSELGELFGWWREHNRKKREWNLSISLELLKYRKIPFEELSPYHFRIGEIDFWPSPGKYYIRNQKKFGRGIFNLLKEIERK